jgi:hypothetical protein
VVDQSDRGDNVEKGHVSILEMSEVAVRIVCITFGSCTTFRRSVGVKVKLVDARTALAISLAIHLRVLADVHTQ